MIGAKRKATRSGPHATNGLVIWKARTRKGISQVALAQAAGIGRLHVISLENGLHLPSGQTRDRIAAALDVAPEEIKSSDDEDEESDPLAVATTDDLLRALFARVGQA